ncbi:MAG: FHA domain-containing protein [Deltaproteobacteria bacterium]|nr:FHA domain-containing protein [Deltaproteobacteria bacterium]
MSTDSTELTFVRCPSCRSLVPAVSTRCRMCGASLDTSSKSDEDDKATKKSGRVRQRTMSSKSDSSVAEVRDQIRADYGKDEEVPSDGVGVDEELEEDFSADDPLSAYLEEVEAEDSAEKNQVEEKLEPASTMEEAPVQKEADEPRAVEEPLESKRSISELKSQRVEAKLAADKDAEVAQPVPDKEPTPAVEPVERPRVIVESGGKPRSQGSMLNFGRPKEADAPAPQPERQERETPIQSAPAQPAPAAKFGFGKPQSERKAAPPREDFEREEAAAPAPPPQREPARVEPYRKGKLRGRLFGWLVNYADSEGSAIELREGKFFISRTSLKNNDMLVDHESISTPHAMVVVDPEHGLRIQDLMSERGIFLRKRASETYQREEDVLVADNGDWVRLGDVEFLVSLVPYVGVK